MDRRRLTILALTTLIFVTSAGTLLPEIYLPIVIRNKQAINTPLPTSTNTVIPTATTQSAPCNCAGSDLDCGDFSSQALAQSCFVYCRDLGYGDVFGLDGDSDGVACESLP